MKQCHISAEQQIVKAIFVSARHFFCSTPRPLQSHKKAMPIQKESIKRGCTAPFGPTHASSHSHREICFPATSFPASDINLSCKLRHRLIMVDCIHRYPDIFRQCWMLVPGSVNEGYFASQVFPLAVNVVHRTNSSAFEDTS